MNTILSPTFLIGSGPRGLKVAEPVNAEGRYNVQCIGPVTVEEGERIVQYVRDHPELIEEFGGHANLEAAERLGIPLMEKWHDEFDNTVVTVGKNAALDAFLAGSAYTVTGPYLGLISSVGYSAISATDTMSSHSGWTEAGSTNAPTYTRPRPTAAWSSASAGSKSLSSALSFAITGTGTVKGAFLVFGSGAVTALDSTAGTLYSAGLFGTGDRAVLSGDTLNVSWTGSL